MTTFKFPNCVNFYTNASICGLIFFISVLVIVFFNILPDVTANIYFYPITLANKLFCLFRPCKQFFFNISHTPLQKNNGPSLRIISMNQLSVRFWTLPSNFDRHRLISDSYVQFQIPFPRFFCFCFCFCCCFCFWFCFFSLFRPTSDASLLGQFCPINCERICPHRMLLLVFGRDNLDLMLI